MTSVCNLLFSVVYLLYLPKIILYVKTKNKKEQSVYCDLIRIICFVLHAREFSVREFSAGRFSGYHLQYGPT